MILLFSLLLKISSIYCSNNVLKTLFKQMFYQIHKFYHDVLKIRFYLKNTSI